MISRLTWGKTKAYEYSEFYWLKKSEQKLLFWVKIKDMPKLYFNLV